MTDLKHGKVIFICTGNSCRSQMAEGFLRYYAYDKVELYSAGSNPGFVHPLAIAVMNEVGIDISRQKSDDVDDYLNADFDYAVTVCSRAEKKCPTFPGQSKRLHWPIPDPAEVTGSNDDIMIVFRSVRDEIGERIREFTG